MDIGKAFSFVFEDEKWVSKVLMGALFSLLGIIIIGWFFVFGYFIELIRNVANRNPNPMPDWDNLGSKFGKGFMMFLVFFVYALPIIVISLCTTLPSVFLSGGSSSSDATSGIAAALSLVGTCLILLYSIVLGVIAPAVTVRYAVTGSFGACFQFGQLLSFITSNLGNYIIVFLLSIVTGFIAELGAIACIIGVFVTAFYAMLVQGNLYGQMYREAVARGTGFRAV